MRHVIFVIALIGIMSTAHAAPFCPRDTVVWINQNTGVYHLPGDRWYGQTKHGAYVCEKQAIAEGDKKSGARGVRHRSLNPKKVASHDVSHSIETQVNDAKPSDNVENPF